mgnify:CR=1 FL=1
MKYNEKNITYIKCANKISTDKITDVQHKANALLFSIQNSHIAPNLTVRAYNTLKECWIELNTMEVKNGKAVPKKQELMNTIKGLIISLRSLQGVTSTDRELQTTLNYNLSRAIAFKNEQHSSVEILERLVALKQLKSDLGEQYQRLNVVQFERIYAELLNELNERLKL